MIKIVAVLLLCISCFAQDGVRLSSVEKEFIVRKYAKIQADLDELKFAHNFSQNDTLLYNRKINIPLTTIKNIGLNCFKFDSTGNYSYDIHIEKLKIKNIESRDFDLYSAYLKSNLKYFIAIDDWGHVYPISNFWIDEFRRFIKCKIGKLDNSDKVLELVRIYTLTKLYKIGPGIILDNENLEIMKNKHPIIKSINNLNSLSIEKDQYGNYKVDTYVYFPADEILDYYNFHVTQSGEIDLKKHTVYPKE